MLTNEQIEQAYKRTREFTRDQANTHQRRIDELRRTATRPGGEFVDPATREKAAYHSGLRDMALKTLAVLRGCSFQELMELMQEEGEV